LFQLAVSMRPISEIGSGLSPDLWKTPVADDTGIRKKKYAQGGTALSMQASQAPQMWPTPTTQDAKNNGGPSQHKRNTKPLNAEVGGPLNPQWVEWLMGYPEGWTDLKD
jgi:hypothetical protein